MKEIKDYLHLYLGCPICLPSSDSQGLNGKLVGILKQSPFDIWQIEMPDGAVVDTEEGLWNDHHGHVKPILRPLSSMTEEEIIQCGKFICAVPNSTDFKYEIQRCHNSVGAKFFSETYTHGQYLSIYNEKNKAKTVGHIEVGWYSSNKIDRRKTKELWKVGGCHEMTTYLLSKHFDLFGLIEAGLAIDKTNL